uniref:Uncharacterized protein n=1 Tax=Glossina austeni TaxID=7395 RepID=A0A1A9VMC5_GLOAU
MARLRRCCCGVNFGFSGSGAGGAGGARWGGGAGAIVGFKIIRDSCRGIQGPSASNGGLITRRVDTGGSDDCDFACCVDKVSNDVTPSVTRAGAASGFIQNETHDIITIMHYLSYARDTHIETNQTSKIRLNLQLKPLNIRTLWHSFTSSFSMDAHGTKWLTWIDYCSRKSLKLTVKGKS